MASAKAGPGNEATSLAARVEYLEREVAKRDGTIADLLAALQESQRENARMQATIREAETLAHRLTHGAVSADVHARHRGRWDGYGPWGHWSCCGDHDRTTKTCTKAAEPAPGASSSSWAAAAEAERPPARTGR
mmetsp:Transcript_52064/g.144258  ORF Transcript_52064/g.144258 Transcript_52064/m.144258 type:complete len:134 (-) Transcript_52064:418-819(-)